MAQTVKCLPTLWETWVQSLGGEDPLEQEMATYTSTFAWKIPQTEEPGRLQAMRSQRVELDTTKWRDFNSQAKSTCEEKVNLENLAFEFLFFYCKLFALQFCVGLHHTSIWWRGRWEWVSRGKKFNFENFVTFYSLNKHLPNPYIC